jgi:hypothetical protein
MANKTKPKPAVANRCQKKTATSNTQTISNSNGTASPSGTTNQNPKIPPRLNPNLTPPTTPLHMKLEILELDSFETDPQSEHESAPRITTSLT